MVVRWADLEIDPQQWAAFKVASTEHAATALQREPGLAALHAVSEKEHPERVRVVEVYRDANVYREHLQTPHFLAWKSATESMVTRRTLYDMVPIMLGAKAPLPAMPVVRVADLTIEPTQLEAYKAAVTEEIEASIRLEPGVLTIYATALKSAPHQLRFFEIYADDAAYEAHIQSAHFQKYVATTKPMISARTLAETLPIVLTLRP